MLLLSCLPVFAAPAPRGSASGGDAFSVPADDLDALEREIIRICETKPYSKENCVKQAEGFDMALRFREYVEMYKESLEK